MNYSIYESYQQSPGNWLTRVKINEQATTYLTSDKELTQDEVNSRVSAIIITDADREDRERRLKKAREDANVTEN
tara:strand:+ start:3456 stop:3680 length:225 start_codon:yes stop_codon:yes gene_type:complete